MKSLIKITAVLFIVLTIYACGSFWQSKNVICSSYDTSISKLPKNLVFEMTDGYKRKQKAAIDDAYNMDDARAIWFDLETLKKFIHDIEKNARNNKENPTGIEKLGVRIYYANYPNQKEWETNYDGELSSFSNDPIKSKYEYKHTLVMIPTITNADGYEMDFDPTDTLTYTSGIENINSSTYTAAFTASSRSSAGSSSPSVSSRNHGTLHPPYSYDGMRF